MEFLTILGGWVVVFGIGVLVSIVRVKRRDQGAAEWPKVTGVIEEAFVYQHERHTQEQRHITYTPVVKYTYTVAGETHTSRKRDFAPQAEASYRNKAQAEGHVAAYPPGSEVPVYYNPDNPRQAVLKTKKPIDHHSELWFGVMNVVVGISILALGLWRG